MAYPRREPGIRIAGRKALLERTLNSIDRANRLNGLDYDDAIDRIETKWGASLTTILDDIWDEAEGEGWMDLSERARSMYADLQG
jgi:hypothetical protein